MRKEPDIRPDVRLPSTLVDRLEKHPSFVRGLVLGMLVGAAIAGSTIWSRLRGTPLRTHAPGDIRESAEERD